MFCPKCGVNNESNVNFCAACGAEMVDNQPGQQSISLDLLRKGVKQQLPKLKESFAQMLTKVKTLPKRVKLVSAVVAALIVVIIVLSVIGSSLTNPETIVKGYFEAKASGDWGKMFSYLSLEESDFINKTSFSKFMAGEKQLDIINYKITAISSKESMGDLSPMDSFDFFKIYTVEYLSKGSSATQTETITLVKKSGKKYLFYDDYGVNPAGFTCSDYQVHVPAGAAAFIDDIQLKQTSEDDSGRDTYIVPEIFLGNHNLRVEHPECEIYTEQIQVYDGYESYVYNLPLRDEVKSDLAKRTEETYKQLISSALAGDEFERLNLVSVNGAAVSGIKDSYGTLASAIRLDESGVGCKSFTVTKVTDNSLGTMDMLGSVSCELSIEYEYTAISKDDWTGDPIEHSDSGSSSISFSYIYENDVWMLSGIYLYGIRLSYGESSLPYIEVVPFKYDYAVSFSEGLAAVWLDGKSGFIDKTGNEVVPFKYDEVMSFSEGLAAVSVGGKWGFVDKTATEVVPCRYDFVFPCSDGLALVALSDGYGWYKYGFIDKTGNEVVPCKYYYGEPVESLYFCEERATVSLDGQSGVIDRNGNLTVPFGKYSYVYNFSDGLAAVLVGDWETGKWGFIDKLGNEVIQPLFDSPGSFCEGLATILVGGKYGFIDKLGNEVIRPLFDSLGAFSEGLAAVQVGDKWGFIDKLGNEVIQPLYDYAGSFSEGLAKVWVSNWETGKWGFVDKTGNEVVPPIYDEVSQFWEGLAAVRVGDWETGKWGFVDKTGNEVVPPIYDEVSQFWEGLAKVRVGDWETGKWGFIDKAGREVTPVEFEAVVDDSEGMTAVQKDGKWGFIQIR